MLLTTLFFVHNPRQLTLLPYVLAISISTRTRSTRVLGSVCHWCEKQGLDLPSSHLEGWNQPGCTVRYWGGGGGGGGASHTLPNFSILTEQLENHVWWGEVFFFLDTCPCSPHMVPFLIVDAWLCSCALARPRALLCTHTHTHTPTLLCIFKTFQKVH